MEIKAFMVEQWMNEYETGAKYNIAETCVDSISLDELFELTGTDKEKFLNEFCARRLTYGDIFGQPKFKKGIEKLYKTIGDDELVITHGAAGANHHVFYSLIEPGDEVISIMPTYQQLYSIPESYGAKMIILRLEEKDKYIPSMDELRKSVSENTKLICINNPNNPTGALISNEQLREIAELAREVGAYVLCDETYRHLTQNDEYCESIADIYEKGISVSGMSKVFSLAGLRLGWIACRDSSFIQSCLDHRDYNLISCGMFDETVASLALENADKIIERNKSIIRENLKILDDWVRGEIHVSYVKPVAGTTALVHYDFDIDSFTFCRDMYHKTGAFVTPGGCFEQEKSMRIGYACDKQVLIDGLKAVSEYFETLD